MSCEGNCCCCSKGMHGCHVMGSGSCECGDCAWCQPKQQSCCGGQCSTEGCSHGGTSHGNGCGCGCACCAAPPKCCSCCKCGEECECTCCPTEPAKIE